MTDTTDNDAETPVAIKENWRALPTEEIPSHIPDCVTFEDEPLAWENKHNGGIVTVDYDPSRGQWQFGGDGSVVATAQSLEEIKAAAVEYLTTTMRPSAMVIG